MYKIIYYIKESITGIPNPNKTKNICRFRIHSIDFPYLIDNST